MTAIRRQQNHWLVTLLRLVLGLGSLLVGAAVVLVVIAVGHCSAFGGSCPGDSGIDNEVFVKAGAGAALAIAGPVFASKPTKRQFSIALFSGLSGGLLVGVAAIGIIHG